MKEVIFYYYGINVSNIVSITNGYSFNYKNNQYLFLMYDRNINDITSLFLLSNYLLSNKIMVHQFIFNKMGSFLTFYNDNNYVLFRVNISYNRIVNINDIISFNIPINSINYPSLVKSDWYNLWTKKIDYLEEQVNHIENTEPFLIESINYFIGLGENAISYLKNIRANSQLVISHRRVRNNDTLLEFYNPLNLVIDYKVRDITEYFKDMFINNYLNKGLLIQYMNYLEYQDYELFYARMVFPTYYFDKYDEIINGAAHKNIICCIDKVDEYEDYLSFIYYFLSSRRPILEIVWLNE